MRYFLAAAAIVFLLDVAVTDLCIAGTDTHAPGEKASLLALDVCFNGGPAVSHGNEYSLINTPLFLPGPDAGGWAGIAPFSFAEPIVFEPIENPPKA